MESLKPALLLLFLTFLGAAAGQNCFFSKKIKLTILSGTFKVAGDEPPLVKIMVKYGFKSLETTAVRGVSPEWNEALQTGRGPKVFALLAKVNDQKPRFVCYVVAREGEDSCRKKRTNYDYRIKYSVSC